MGTMTTADPTTECGQAAIGPADQAAAPAAPSNCGQTATLASGCGQSETVASSCGQNVGPQWLDAAQMRTWRAFLSSSTLVTSRLNHELEVELGLSLHEYEILVRLSEAPSRTLRMSVLADDVAHSRSRLTHTVRRLEKAGYVERTSCSSDGRGVNCHITDAGMGFLGQAAPVHLAGVRRHVIDRLTPGQLASLADLLEILATPEGATTCGQGDAA